MKKLKKLVSLSLIAVITATSSFANAALLDPSDRPIADPALKNQFFSDVPVSHPYYDAIKYVKEKGIVEGYANNKYQPDKLINRAEFTKIIMETTMETSYARSCFSDVKYEWYAVYVCDAKKYDIIKGYADNTFRPERNISFAEASKITVKALGYKVDEDAEVWYEPFVNVLKEKNAIPDSIGTNYSQELNRGEMAYIIYQIRSNDPYYNQFEAVKEKIDQEGSNAILYTQMKMLSHKAGNVKIDEYQYAPDASNIRNDLSGGFGYSFRNNNELDVLTGKKAIDESLQTESIGDWQRENKTSLSEANIDISELKSVEIASHDYGQMIKDENITPDMPKISEHVPADYFMVYFDDGKKFKEFRNSAEKLYETASPFYEFADVEKVEKMVFERLAIPYSENFYDMIDEMAFVSDDLSYFTRSDFAVIIKFANPLASTFADSMASTGENKFGKISDYYVFATSEETFNHIQNTNHKMSDELDFQYATGVLEKDREGLIYFSERFIRKLTSPEYRLNSRRKNTALRSLETLQYIVWAYYLIEDKYPLSFDQMEAEGYIIADNIFEKEKYTIDKEGIVKHADWGSSFEPTPVNRVEIDKITSWEKDEYEDFSSMYQSYYTEFFDPVGIAVSMDDKISFHTVILPLIENSDYNWLKTAFNNSNLDEIDFIKNPDREAALFMGAKLSFDDILAKIGEEEMRYARSANDQEEKEGKTEKEVYIEAAESEVKEYLELPQNERVFDFIGDEITFGVGKDSKFAENNIPDFDLFMGIKLKDTEKAKLFLKRAFEKIGEEMGGNRGGMFMFSTTEPLKNTYNEVEYYTVPTGFINVFYTFIDDKFYLTISQVAMNRVIDGSKNTANNLTENQKDTLAKVGLNKNILVLADTDLIPNWFSDYREDFNREFKRDLSRVFEDKKAYLSEVLTLQEILDQNNLKAYYKNIPEDFFGHKFSLTEGRAFISVNGQKYDLAEISSDYTYYDDEQSNGRKNFNMIYENIDLYALFEDACKMIKGAGIGLVFTEHGLDIRMSVQKP